MNSFQVFVCPGCGARIHVPGALTGRTFRHSCGVEIAIPKLGAATPPPPAPPPVLSATGAPAPRTASATPPVSAVAAPPSPRSGWRVVVIGALLLLAVGLGAGGGVLYLEEQRRTREASSLAASPPTTYTANYRTGDANTAAPLPTAIAPVNPVSTVAAQPTGPTPEQQKLDEVARLAGELKARLEAEERRKAELERQANSGPNAYVQTFKHEEMSRKDLFGDVKTYPRITAQVKFNRTCSVTVRGGYIKNGDWHTGEFVGTRYFDDKLVHGNAGDTVEVTIDCLNVPPLNRTVSAGVLDR